MNYRDLAIGELVELHPTVIADVFPGLRQHATRPIDPHLLDQRSITTLKRRGCVTWGDLGSLTVGDLWSVPNAGRLTVERILAAARDKEAQSPVAGNWWPPPVPGTGANAPDPTRSSLQLERVRALVEMLADWATDINAAVTLGDLLDSLERPLPAQIAAALADARRLAIADVLRGSSGRNTSSLIVEFLGRLGSDARFVTERHVAKPAGRVPTLDAVGERQGITRERVRQIVKRGLERADSLRLDARFRMLGWRADEIVRTLGAACPVSSSAAVDAIDRAARGFIDPDECTAREFMLWLAGGYRELEGWWVSEAAGRLDMLRDAMRAALGGGWLLQRQRLLDTAAAVGFATEIDDEHLATLSGWRRIGEGWWLRWDGSLGDKAERVLRLSLRPLRPDELNELIGDGYARSSVQNVLSLDLRFTRVSMDLKFALTEWGWEEYSTAAQEIVERIERSGGEAMLDDIVVELFNQFGLKESTIRAYAASPAFVVTNGRIRLRRENEVLQVNDRIASAPGLYLAPNGSVIYHVRVDADLLRGSGRPIPSPLAVAVGVRPGGGRTFTSGDGGRVRVSWLSTTTTGATIGSTRAMAEHVGAELGDVLRLVFDLDNDTVRGSRVVGTDLHARTGLTLTTGGEAAELAIALNVPPTEVRAALAQRGDGELAALIPEPKSSAGLDDALSRLDGLLG